MMKKLLPVIVAVLALGGAYKFVLAKPAAAPKPKPHVEGKIYILGKEFLVNLADGRFAKLTVALLLKEDDTSAAAAAEGEGATKPPDGFGTMAQEAVVRDVITNDLTDAKDNSLVDREGREKLKAKILKDLKKKTDVKVEEVLFTDVTVQ
jgi:flagellar basal body-associated protein FliL